MHLFVSELVFFGTFRSAGVQGLVKSIGESQYIVQSSMVKAPKYALWRSPNLRIACGGDLVGRHYGLLLIWQTGTE